MVREIRVFEVICDKCGKKELIESILSYATLPENWERTNDQEVCGDCKPKPKVPRWGW